MLKSINPKRIQRTQWYVLCGYDRNNIYDEAFWEKDIRDLFERIHILKSYGASPYIMRYEAIYESRWRSFYAAICAWCNRFNLFWTQTFRSYTWAESKKAFRQLEEIEKLYPDIAKDYFDLKITRKDVLN